MFYILTTTDEYHPMHFKKDRKEPAYSTCLVECEEGAVSLITSDIDVYVDAKEFEITAKFLEPHKQRRDPRIMFRVDGMWIKGALGFDSTVRSFYSQENGVVMKTRLKFARVVS